MDREVLINATFEENCEYLSSTISKKVPIPQQIVKVSLNAPENLENREENIFYFDDRIQLTAMVYQEHTTNNNNIERLPVQTGRIEFYFQPENSTTLKLINEKNGMYNTCELNQHGSAAVIFKPKTSGTVFAKYVDDNELYTAVTDISPEGTSNRESIILNEIPIKINFTEIPPYLANVHDEVTIQVHVTNEKDGQDIQCGTVTFMHYLTYDDIDDPNKRVPKIIGNPVPVINGYAKISYIPVQTDDDTEPEILEENGNSRYVEYIRASYNYRGKYIDTDKDDYKWKYYGTASKWTGINVLARNSITIAPTSLPMSDELNIYQCSENDTINLVGVLKDKNGENIEFDNHSGTLTFYVTGTHAHPKKKHMQSNPPITYSSAIDEMNANFEFIPYETEITATFSNNQFHAQLSNLLPGFYTITAETEIQTDKHEILIDYPETTTEDVRNDKKYQKVTDSNTIYIMSNYAEVSENYNIDLQHDDSVAYIGSRVNNLRGTITGLSKKQMQILNNQECKFYVRELNKTYRGTLSYIENSTVLYATLIEDIIFNIVGNYTVYMYVLDGVYTDNISVDTYNNHNNVYDFYLPYIISPSITIQARERIELELNVDIISAQNPTKFSYNLKGTNIIDPTDIQIIAKTQSNEKVVDNVSLFKQATTASNTITLKTPGEYEIYAKTGDIISNKINISVERDTLKHILPESSKNTYGANNNTIGIYLQCNDNINKIDYNKLKFELYDSNKVKIKDINIQNKRIDKKVLVYIILFLDIKMEGEWYLKVSYEGDDTFKQYNSTLEKITTVLDEPSVKLIPSGNIYGFQISGAHAPKNNIIVGKVKFLFKNTLIHEGIWITNLSGYGEFYDPENYEDVATWWNEWDNIVFLFDAYDTEIMSILLNNQVPYNALYRTYDYVFDYEEITNSVDLREQLHSNNDENIYNGYKTAQIRLARPTTL